MSSTNTKLVETVEKIYATKELMDIPFNELTRKRGNKDKVNEIMKIRIDRQYTFMSGKETLDNVLKKAYMYDFPTLSKEKIVNNEIKELQDVLKIISTQLISLCSAENANEVEIESKIKKKEHEKEILEVKLESILEKEVKDDKPNYNGIAMKILRILEKGDYVAKKLHFEIKTRVCKTTDTDDYYMRKELNKYLIQPKWDSDEAVKTDGSKPYKKHFLKKDNYVLPHLRKDDSMSQQITPGTINDNQFPILSVTNVKIQGVWGSKNIVNVIKESMGEQPTQELPHDSFEVIIDKVSISTSQEPQITHTTQIIQKNNSNWLRDDD